jgi:hypothetical protein
MPSEESSAAISSVGSGEGSAEADSVKRLV